MDTREQSTREVKKNFFLKRTALFVATAFAASMLMAGGTLAAVEGKSRPNDSGAAAGQSMEKDQQKKPVQQEKVGAAGQQQNIRSAAEIEGAAVQNTKGEKLGKVSKLLIDLKSGQVGYAIVSAGGVLGMGEKKYIVPFKALKPGESGTLLLDVPAGKLKEAPEGNLEQALNRQQGAEIHRFYGVAPYWESSGAQQQEQQQKPQQQPAGSQQ